jgi:hypothetical protein
MDARISSHFLKSLAISLGGLAAAISLCSSVRGSEPDQRVGAGAALNASAAAISVDDAKCGAAALGARLETIKFQLDGASDAFQTPGVARADALSASTCGEILNWQGAGIETSRLIALFDGDFATIGLAASQSSESSAADSPTDPPSYLPWYTAIPSPFPTASAYVGVGGAWGAANVYNTGVNAFGAQAPGTGVLNTGRCYFLCFGAPGRASHHFLAYGNDVVPPVSPGPGTSYTHNGAADDCTLPTPPPAFSVCPGGIANQVFGVSVTPTTTPGGYLVALDGNGNLGVLTNLYAGAAVVAGAGFSTPEPSPAPGSLVSYTGIGSGDFILGSSATGTSVKCDFGETTMNTVTCNRPFVVSNGGIQPDGATGGYIPVAFPIGIGTPHPQILSASCTVTGSGACTFPNGFTFGDTTYQCTVSAQGTTPVADSYVRDSASQISIYTGLATSKTISYICMR